MPSNSPVLLCWVAPQGSRCAQNPPKSVFGTFHVVKEWCLVIGLADLADDRAGLEVGIDLFVDLDQVAVLFKGLDERSEIHVRQVLVGLGKVVALLGKHSARRWRVLHRLGCSSNNRYFQVGSRVMGAVVKLLSLCSIWAYVCRTRPQPSSHCLYTIIMVIGEPRYHENLSPIRKLVIPS